MKEDDIGPSSKIFLHMQMDVHVFNYLSRCFSCKDAYHDASRCLFHGTPCCTTMASYLKEFKTM